MNVYSDDFSNDGNDYEDMMTWAFKRKRKGKKRQKEKIEWKRERKHFLFHMPYIDPNCRHIAGKFNKTELRILVYLSMSIDEK